MKRGPKPGRAHRRKPVGTLPSGLGDCPSELTGLGRDLWLDAVADLEAQAGRCACIGRGCGLPAD